MQPVPLIYWATRWRGGGLAARAASPLSPLPARRCCRCIAAAALAAAVALDRCRILLGCLGVDRKRLSTAAGALGIGVHKHKLRSAAQAGWQAGQAGQQSALGLQPPAAPAATAGRAAAHPACCRAQQNHTISTVCCKDKVCQSIGTRSKAPGRVPKHRDAYQKHRAPQKKKENRRTHLSRSSTKSILVPSTCIRAAGSTSTCNA